MARKIEEIQLDILNAFASNTTTQRITSTSRSAVYRVVSFIVATIIHFHEVMFDNHVNEVKAMIYNQKNARLPWYRTMALKFQYGFDLIPDTDNFDNAGATQQEIEVSKVVKYSAVVESENESRVILKIAGDLDGELGQLPTLQKTAFDAYVKEFKPAGVKVTVINYQADKLFPDLTIYRDALLIDDNGMSILNGNYPVNDAILEFMKELPFNGAFIIQDFVDKLQKVPGVKIAHVNNIESSWIDPNIGDYGSPVSIYVKRIAESGYFKVETFDNIDYVV